MLCYHVSTVAQNRQTEHTFGEGEAVGENLAPCKNLLNNEHTFIIDPLPSLDLVSTYCPAAWSVTRPRALA